MAYDASVVCAHALSRQTQEPKLSSGLVCIYVLYDLSEEFCIEPAQLLGREAQDDRQNTHEIRPHLFVLEKLEDNIP